jgi:Protein of unknown function (DUF3037)
MIDRGGGADETWIDYEWASLRIVPRVHAEEFVNAGVILHARRAHFLEARLGMLWEECLTRLAPELAHERVREHLESYVRIARGDESAGPIALLPPSERFHWLVQPRSGILQTSAPHPGRCHDPSLVLASLLDEQCRA